MLGEPEMFSETEETDWDRTVAVAQAVTVGGRRLAPLHILPAMCVVRAGVGAALRSATVTLEVSPFVGALRLVLLQTEGQ